MIEGLGFGVSVLWWRVAGFWFWCCGEARALVTHTRPNEIRSAFGVSAYRMRVSVLCVRVPNLQVRDESGLII